jgi:TFIIF-interacting CTD phosphatase-like protein
MPKMLSMLCSEKDIVESLRRLVESNCSQFAVLDDRGGSGYWRVHFAPTPDMGVPQRTTKDSA